MALKIFNVILYREEDIDYVKCSVVTIGTFDGLHRGHQHLLDWCKEIAKNHDCQWIVYTFEPHPREVLGYDNFKLITTIEEKLWLFEKFGVEYVYLKHFTREFSQKTAQEFLEQELIKKFKLKHLVIGYDHQLGKDRQGSYEVLKSMSDKYEFNLYRMEPVFHGELTISSTKIRHALEEGNIGYANEMLGYPFMLSGKVVKGLKIGRSLGFPTANLLVENHKKLIPKTGVYVVKVKIGNGWYKGVLNIGYRPTLNIPEHPLSIEVHIIEFEGNLYEKNLTVFLLYRIRDDERFESLDELKKWIVKDVEFAKNFFEKSTSITTFF